MAMEKTFDEGYVVRLWPGEMGDGLSRSLRLSSKRPPGSKEHLLISGSPAAHQNQLPHIIIRFREEDVAWAADIWSFPFEAIAEEGRELVESSNEYSDIINTQHRTKEWETSTEPSVLKKWRSHAKDQHTLSIDKALLSIESDEDRFSLLRNQGKMA